MKNIIKKIIASLGYKIAPIEKGNYSELLNIERHKPLNIKIARNNFKIADSLSFYYSYKEIFEGEIYKFNSNNNRPNIVDCGSNCGLSILYFKTIFPNSKIKGIEADPYIFEILKSNVNEFKLSDVELFNCALWDEITTVDFYSEKADAGKIILKEETKKDNTIKIKTRLLSNFIKETDIDFLKIDIEGAETRVLAECKNYLKNVKNIFIEYHSFLDKEQNLDLLISILKENNFRYQIQTQFSSAKPYTENKLQEGMDMQLNIFAYRKQ